MGLLVSVQLFSGCYFPKENLDLILFFRKEVMILKLSPSGSLTHAGFCTVWSSTVEKRWENLDYKTSRLYFLWPFKGNFKSTKCLTIG